MADLPEPPVAAAISDQPEPHIAVIVAGVDPPEPPASANEAPTQPDPTADTFAWIFIWLATAIENALFPTAEVLDSVKRRRVESYVEQIEELTRMPNDMNITNAMFSSKDTYLKFLTESEIIDINLLNDQNRELLIDIVKRIVELKKEWDVRYLAVQGLFDYVSLSTDDVYLKKFFGTISDLISAIKRESNLSDNEFVDKIEAHLGQQQGFYSLAQAQEIEQYFLRPVSKKDLKVFAKLCENCKCHGGVNYGENRVFISVSSPSYTGKTQMSVSLDSLSAFPLMGNKNPNAPLFVVLRISVDIFQGFDSSQTINANIFYDSLTKLAEEDYKTLKKSFGNGNSCEKMSLKVIVSGSHIVKTFVKEKSHLLSLFLFWIQSRTNESERKSFCSALEGGHCVFKGFVPPLTVHQFNEEVKKLNPTDKPMVAVLDEFNVTKFSIDRKSPILLRNLLRVARFAVICMGTNSKASNLIETFSRGGRSGIKKAPWVHVVTNVFSNNLITEEDERNPNEAPPPAERDDTDNPQGRLLNKDSFRVMKDWIGKSPCFRPGILQIFLEIFDADNSNDAFEAKLKKALQAVGTEMQDRKERHDSVFWLVGQVAALFPRYRALENSVPSPNGKHTSVLGVVIDEDVDKEKGEESIENEGNVESGQTEEIEENIESEGSEESTKSDGYEGSGENIEFDENEESKKNASDKQSPESLETGESDKTGEKIELDKKTYDILLSEHYAYLQTYSPNESAYFFTLERHGAYLYVLPWTEGKSDDGRFKKFSYDPKPESKLFQKIDFTENELSAKAASVITAGGKEYFKGYSVFPSFQCDELSFLCFFANDPFFAFVEALTGEARLVDIAQSIIGESDICSGGISLTSRAAVTIFHRMLYGAQMPRENSLAMKRQGEFLENLSMSAIVVATHRSLSGTKFAEYLPRLVGELSMRKTDLELDGDIGDIGDFIFPFIPVVGGKVSVEFMNLPGVNCGFIDFVKDSEQIDGFGHANCLVDDKVPGYSEETAVFFTGEQKSHDENISFPTIKDSCQKAYDYRKNLKTVEERPIRVHFHFVIVSQLDLRIDWKNDRHKIFDNQRAEQDSEPYSPEERFDEINSTERRTQPHRSAKNKSPANDSDKNKRSSSPTVIVCQKVGGGKLSFKFYGDEPYQQHKDGSPLFCLVIIPVENLFPHDGILGYCTHSSVTINPCCQCSVSDCSNTKCGCFKRNAKCAAGCHETCKNQDSKKEAIWSKFKSKDQNRGIEESVAGPGPSSKLRKIGM